AFAFRLLLAGQEPFLSDDVYRYIWDGRVQAAGLNPYSYVPEAPELNDLRDKAVYEHIPVLDRRWITPYPPAAQLIFRLAYRASLATNVVAGFKRFFASFDLIAIACLIFALKRTGENPARVVVFAWHPLLIFESAHS